MKGVITGGTGHQSIIAEKTVEWCLTRLKLSPDLTIRLNLISKRGCWGECVEGDEPGSYIIHVEPRQSLRDFVATICHEMIHVQQWETGKWDGDGEKEAERRQYRLTDELWKENLL